MAIDIKSVPTLEKKVASDFIKEAKKSYENKGKIDFSKEIKAAKKILQNSSIYSL